MTRSPRWGHAGLACLVAGLLLSPLLDAPPGWPAAPLAAAVALAAAIPGRRRGSEVEGTASAPLPVAARTALYAVALLAGMGIGDARLAVNRAGAVSTGEEGLAVGAEARVSGFIVTTPRPLGGQTRFALETTAGRIGVAVPRPLPELRVGTAIEAAGRVEGADGWLEGFARRDGWALELAARRVETLPGGRSGLTGYLDRARARAEAGLTAGLDPPDAALARGFVLGQDEAIDPQVREDFRRSGLAHLLILYTLAITPTKGGQQCQR